MSARLLGRLLAHFGGPEQLLAAPARVLRQAGLSSAAIEAVSHAAELDVSAELAWLARERCHMICAGEADFPPLLADISRAPLCLFVHGDPTLLWTPQLAVVGSRRASASGIRNARAFARAAARSGLTITSGLAQGIDGAAHEAALAAGGRTVAVLGSGCDVIYPPRHVELAERIVADGGAIVSEFLPGTRPAASHFPRRNRVISGLSLGVLVVEASVRSGSLITARLAAEQGREIFALPGSIHNPLARGCHALIKQGASLIETEQEMLEALSPLASKLGAEIRSRLDIEDASTAPNIAEHDLDPEYDRLLGALSFDTLTIDELVDATGLDTAAISSMLLILELDGRVTACPGGGYARVLEESQ